VNPLLELADSVDRQLREQIATTQNGLPRAFDKTILNAVSEIRSSIRELAAGVLPEARHRIRGRLVVASLTLSEYKKLRDQPRLTSYSSRVQHRERESTGTYWGATCNDAMQGVRECLQWRGIPLFKRATELGIYSMLIWDLKPSTIVELGSGLGASALWFADTTNAFGVSSRIISLDVTRPRTQTPLVTFLEGDCNDIEAALPPELLGACDHPWLVVEDSHINVGGVLRYLEAFLSLGDYLVVEDTWDPQKAAALDEFMEVFGSRFSVDTRYTDFFGRNATVCRDSILLRIA
jgi:cephalosporin hydroxylase